MDNLEGGKAIGSGGYGCVFSPSLKCPNMPQDSTKISKLMTNVYANEEYELSQKLNLTLQNIPNYDNYFLLKGINICHPDELSRLDLINYNKCEPLIEDGITEQNINQNLNKISIINMPNGGTSVSTYIKHNFNSRDLINLNNSLIDLLMNAVIPMNNLQIYHNDLKSSNMLVEKKNGGINVRIIDWGLSFTYTHSNYIDALRPFQFNLPFSCILFGNKFKNDYELFYAKNSAITYLNVQMWVVSYLNDSMRSNKGSLPLIRIIIKRFNFLKANFMNKNKLISSNDYIVNYLADIIFKYTNLFKSDLVKNKNIRVSEYILTSYFNEIYLKNVDIWGFVITYWDIFNFVYSDELLMSKNIQLLNKIKQITINHLYLNSIKPINVTSLIDDLKLLNNHFKRLKMNNTVDLNVNVNANIGGKKLTINRKKYIKKYKSFKKHSKKNNKNNKTYKKRIK